MCDKEMRGGFPSSRLTGVRLGSYNTVDSVVRVTENHG